MDDPLQKLADESPICCAVLGNSRSNEIMLIDLDRRPWPEPGPYQAAGFFFAGVVGFRQGKAESHAQPGIDATCAVLRASIPFAEYVTHKLKSQQRRGDADWLQRLYDLPDPRGN
jgi:hypothetical protein